MTFADVRAGRRGGMIRHIISRNDQFVNESRRVDAKWYERAAAHPRRTAGESGVEAIREPLERYQVCVHRIARFEVHLLRDAHRRERSRNDVEHFRPKAKSGTLESSGMAGCRRRVLQQPDSGTKGDPGYRKLAYCPWNYAASCKNCNSVLKKNYFPELRQTENGGNGPGSDEGGAGFVCLSDREHRRGP